MQGRSPDSRTDDGVRVLVVEGKARKGVAVRNCLKAAPAEFVVSPARRLWSASQILAGISIDAIVLDLDLPDSDDLKAFYELRERAPDVPVILVGASRKLAERALEDGADGWLDGDDLDPNTLGVRILEAIEERRNVRVADQSPSETSHTDEDVSSQILLVEDDPWVQRLLQRNLRRQGHCVEALDTPNDALAWAQRVDSPLDLLICDASPPGMDGRRLSEHLERRFSDLVTLLVCSDPQRDAAELDDFIVLTRPYTLDEFEATVRQLVTPSR